jgi:hypothetical protein
VATARRSASAPNSANPPSPIVDGFALSGVSSLPDPATHAYRKDLADTALAGRVIASHYAEPLLRHIAVGTLLWVAPSTDSVSLGTAAKGDEFRLLDSSRGWAWGYLSDGRVAYVPADAITA